MIKAVIFDMDGLLIDSEPLWKQAETEVFSGVGISLDAEMGAETTGLRVDEVVDYWYRRFPWETPSKSEVAAQIVRRLIELIDTSGSAMVGVDRAFEVINRIGLPMAIASSSTDAIIDAVLHKIGGAQHMLVIHSAEHEQYGKPHPGVYISAAEKLGVSPAECVALEDSVNGVLAAKAAKMRCIAVPEPAMREDRRFGIADAVIGSLDELTVEILAGA